MQVHDMQQAIEDLGIAPERFRALVVLAKPSLDVFSFGKLLRWLLNYVNSYHNNDFKGLTERYIEPFANSACDQSLWPYQRPKLSSLITAIEQFQIKRSSPSTNYFWDRW